MVAGRQQTVPVTVTTKADAPNLVNLREQFKTTGCSSPIPGYHDVIMKLVPRTLVLHLLLAGRWAEDAIVLNAENKLHLGMAIDTDDGLLVPVIRTWDNRCSSNWPLGHANSPIRLALENSLTPTCRDPSSPSPIFNVPETAILGLGAIHREPVLLDGAPANTT